MKKVKLTLASFLANFAFISSLMSLSSSVGPETLFMAVVFAAAATVSWRGYLFWAWERDGAGRFGGIFANHFSRLESGDQTARSSLSLPLLTHLSVSSSPSYNQTLLVPFDDCWSAHVVVAGHPIVVLTCSL